MNFADKLRKELNNKNEEIIARDIEPHKDEIMEILARGIKRLGYVKADTLCGTGTCEGRELGVNSDNIEAFAEFLKKEGFRVQKSWWGYSSDGKPDMLTISL
jgi:hypothetical protein